MKIVTTNRRPTPRPLPHALAAALSLILAAGSAAAQQTEPGSDASAADTAQAASGAQAPTQLDTVEVKGVRGSIASAIALKQNSTQITDSIVAEDVGKLPDNSVAAALQRVTGVQVARSAGEVSTVLVRGLPDVVTTLNGRNVFTTTGRSMTLADIPADLLQRVDVYKTSGAENIEGGIGGLIDVRLRRPFDFQNDWTLAGSARALYSRNSGEADPNGSLTANKLWHTDAGKFGVMGSVSYQSQQYQESNTFNGTYTLKDNPANPGEQIYVPDTIGSIYTIGDRDRRSANLTLQWAPNENTELYFENFYVGYRNDSQVNFWIPLPTLVNADNVVSVTTKPGTNVAQSITARDLFTLTSNQAYANTSDTYQSAIGGSWKGERLSLSTDLAYTYSKADNRSFILDTAFIAPSITMNFDNKGASDARVSNADGSAYGVADASNYWLHQYYDAWSRQEGKDWSWKGDGSFRLDAGPLAALDFGFRASRREAKNVAADTGGRTNISGGTVFVDDLAGLASTTPSNLLNGERSVSTSQWMVADRDYLLANAGLIRAAMGYDAAAPTASPSLYFDDKEDSYAAYLQARYSTSVGGMNLDGAVGVRAVKLDAQLQGTQIVDGANSPVSIDKSDTELLPSFSANLSIRDDLLLRASYGKSITRASFSALNPQLSLYQATATVPATGSGGNPDLNPVKSENLDLSLEWYFRPGSLLSAAAFYRRIDGYIQTYASDEVINGVTYSVSRPRNTGDGTLKGIELAYTQFYDFLPGWLSGFGTQLNATFIDAQTESPSGQMQDLVNVSDRAYNAVLIYQKGAFSSRLAYNWRSEYALSYTASGDQPQSIYVAPTDSLDFAMNYDIDDAMTVSLEATNLLGQVTRNYFGDSYRFPRDIGVAERTFSLGLRFRF
ncbi:TonB-dependent receptor [Xanthomonas sp. CFBP 8703]|uniref:TonB-dependent receptor n=1 Tax=Xanthomonas bonasiae TaxID=2810351 RepID=A0ABS3B3I1_9XANT|nr:TonB-dependent receptor [Xanthomonas bonasiae]MBN6102888.1 TonB-dependent receptor [Xanthomonas bonasiae]